ncbi:hypothetical protein HDU79_008589 [Rhizoclosmatium sp. JEL0117]|nr:hypothetical protein HDU99_008133 [Rhizoclosmatium hyalinum]KAJ3284007.1 hypothetical protein HDU79_008589 [Rhizoclosmatium sp. JEL0117]
MFFASRLLRQAVKVKESTLLTGLAVHPNARAELLVLLHRIQHTSANRLPASFAFRQSVEAVTASRIKIVEENLDVAAIEEKIDNGTIEELLTQAEAEISLINKMAEWEAWKPLEAKVPEGQWSTPLV